MSALHITEASTVQMPMVRHAEESAGRQWCVDGAYRRVEITGPDGSAEEYGRMLF